MFTTKDAFMRAHKLVERVAENRSLEALLLCQRVLGLDKTDILAGTPTISSLQYKEVISLAKKRALGYPLQYIMGEWEFYGRSFLVGDGVLIPRADTETLIDAVLERSKGMPPPLNILDLCSGSGCIAITLSKEIKNSNVYALEIDKNALSYLKQNIEKHDCRVTIIEGDALSYRTNKQFDVIVSNPPYLTRADMESLQQEVTYEPSVALYGGEDGLDFYRRITEHWKKTLKKGGLMAFEIGMGQEYDVAEIMSNNCLISTCASTDMCGIIRVVTAIRE